MLVGRGVLTLRRKLLLPVPPASATTIWRLGRGRSVKRRVRRSMARRLGIGPGIMGSWTILSLSGISRLLRLRIKTPAISTPGGHVHINAIRP